MMQYPTDLATTNPYGLQVNSPIIAAAGCLGYGIELAKSAAIDQIGALVTPTTSLRGRRGPAPRLIETRSGLLYAGRWPDRGLAYVLDRCVSIWALWQTPVILSVSGSNPQEAAEIARNLEGVEGVAGIELDLSYNPERGEAAIQAVRAVTLLPILAKLPAEQPALQQLSQLAGAAGADLLVVAAPPHASWEGQAGRLCGPAWAPLALQLVKQVLGSTTIPVIGAGGIGDLADAKQMLALGAVAVQIGSALLAHPGLAAELAQADFS